MHPKEVMQQFGLELGSRAQEEHFGSRAAVAPARRRVVATSMCAEALQAQRQAKQVRCESHPDPQVWLAQILVPSCLKLPMRRQECREVSASLLAAVAHLRGWARPEEWRFVREALWARAPQSPVVPLR